MSARLDVSALRRILAVRLDNLGDVVMTGPALRALRRAAPGARITLLCSPAGSRAAALLPWVDDVVVHRAPWQDASGSLRHDTDREGALIQALRGHDAAFVFTSFAQSPHPPAYACYLAGIPVRVGSSKEFGGAVLSHDVPPLPDTAHETDRNLALLEGVGVPLAGTRLQIAVPDSAAAAAVALLADVGVAPGRPYVVLAPGASCDARRYPPGRAADVLHGLRRALAAPVVVLGSADEREHLAPVAAAGADLVGRTSIVEAAAVIAGARLVVATNSAPLHLADAAGRPLVVLYSGTELESQFAPRSVPARVLRRPTPCSPCRAFACPYDLDCLDVPPGDVVDAAVELLDSARQPVLA